MKRLTGKQQAFVREYCSNSFNASQAARDAGYKGNLSTIGTVAVQNMQKPAIKGAIAEELAKNQAKANYDYDKAISELNSVITNLAEAAKAGNISANSALTAAIREKNAITGLHVQVIKTDTDQTRELSESERREADRLAAELLKPIKLVKNSA